MRQGYTTGTCATAGAKAACLMLLGGAVVDSVTVSTPRGIVLNLEILDIQKAAGRVSCAVVKDSGSDPDITNGIRIYALVECKRTAGIIIDGGEGIGRVTKAGLDQPIGAAAINRTPRQTIAKELETLCKTYAYTGGLKVTISAPEGVALAKRTFNPRLGIVGGISILGTSGIVDPMSEEALLQTIALSLRQRVALGKVSVLLTPGNYGERFSQTQFGLSLGDMVQCSNFIGASLDFARDIGIKRVLLVGHIGKLVKLVGNCFQTHSKYGDNRGEIFAAYTALAGARQESIAGILQASTTEAMLDILDPLGLRENVLGMFLAKIEENLRTRWGDDLDMGLVLFSQKHGFLIQSQNVPALLAQIHNTEEERA